MAGAVFVALAACAPQTTVLDGPDAARPPGWQFATAEHIALWYHGLAIVGVDHPEFGPGVDSDEEPAPTPLPLPVYRTGYADAVAALKRQRGIEPTALEARADEFRARFADPSSRGIQFVPLYFEDLDALFSGIRAWDRAGGDPRRANGNEAARVVAFLSSVFPRAAQREAVVEWAAALEAEHGAFFGAYWEELEAELARGAEAVAAEWDALRASLAGYLLHTRLRSAEILLMPALGPEGRMIVQGTRVPRIAMASPSDTGAHGTMDPERVVFGLLREITYALAGEAVREHVAPARIRVIGESVLTARAATHAGLELVARAAPDRVEAYRRFFLEQAGVAAPEDPAVLDAAFAETFPLPEGLGAGLREVVQQALAGI